MQLNPFFLNFYTRPFFLFLWQIRILENLFAKDNLGLK